MELLKDPMRSSSHVEIPVFTLFKKKETQPDQR